MMSNQDISETLSGPLQHFRETLQRPSLNPSSLTEALRALVDQVFDDQHQHRDNKLAFTQILPEDLIDLCMGRLAELQDNWSVGLARGALFSLAALKVRPSKQVGTFLVQQVTNAISRMDIKNIKEVLVDCAQLGLVLPHNTVHAVNSRVRGLTSQFKEKEKEFFIQTLWAMAILDAALVCSPLTRPPSFCDSFRTAVQDSRISTLIRNMEKYLKDPRMRQKGADAGLYFAGRFLLTPPPEDPTHSKFEKRVAGKLSKAPGVQILEPAYLPVSGHYMDLTISFCGAAGQHKIVHIDCDGPQHQVFAVGVGPDLNGPGILRTVLATREIGKREYLVRAAKGPATENYFSDALSNVAAEEPGAYYVGPDGQMRQIISQEEARQVPLANFTW